MLQSMTRWLGVLIAVLAASTPAALAQDGGEIARHAVQAMQRVTQATQDDIGDTTAAGIAAIQRLDQGGASDRDLIAAAHRATNAIDHEARSGARRINMIAARAIEALRQINADRRFFAIVHNARDESLETIGQARRRGTAAVQAALDEALNN